MLNNLGFWELGFLIVLALFIFGPERLPKVAADAGRLLRQLRRLANDATADIKAELGPEMADLDLTSLHPRRFVQKHLFQDDEEAPPPVATRPRPEALPAGERPPYDVEAT